MSTCPLCSKKCSLYQHQNLDAECTKSCDYSKMLILDDDVLGIASDMKRVNEANRICNTIFSDLISHRKEKAFARHYILNLDNDQDFTVTNDTVHVNVRSLMNHYPDWMLDRYDLILLNSYHIFQGKPILVYGSGDRTQARMLLLEDPECGEDMEIIHSMNELGYFTIKGSRLFYTRFAWERLSELIQRNEGSKNAFIALGYSGTAEIRKVIKEALIETGYNPIVMDETQHNNQIVPEMFDYIKRSRFLVMDMTYPNHGAYYEAGLARGMGKQTILTCHNKEMHSEDKSERPHFDVAQQSTVVWTDYKDLKTKLTERIRMTIE